MKIILDFYATHNVKCVFFVMKRKIKEYLERIKKFMWILHILSCIITVVFVDVCIKIIFKFSIIDLIQDRWLFGIIFLFKKLRDIPEKIINWWERQKLYFHLSLIASLGVFTVLSKIEYNIIKRIK